MKIAILNSGRLLAPMTLLMCLTSTVDAAVPGITGAGAVATFNLDASPASINQPDGSQVYSWGYGCTAGLATSTAPAAIGVVPCPTMQIPGPTLIVKEGA